VLAGLLWAVVLAPVRTWRVVRLVNADSLRGASWPRVFRVRRMFLSVFVSIRLASCFWPVGVWRTVRATPVAHGPSEDRARTVHYSRSATGGFAFFFRLSFRDSRIVRLYHADCPPGHRGPSAWCLIELLRPLLLDSCFRFGIIWGLFLGLVGP
jgi:hypothetical protein